MGSRSSLQSSPSVDADVGADTDAGEQQPPPPPWREIVGSNDWDNLLDPLNLNLRQLILRCGDFCQATYDAFNNDANSKFAGSSRYGRKSFFQKVLLQDAQNYQVSCFLYATARVSVPEAFLLHSLARDGSWDRESNWIGYTAVTTDEYSVSIGRREIYVAFRGTSRNYEWVNILGAQLEPATELLAPQRRGRGEQPESDAGLADDVHLRRPEFPIHETERQIAAPGHHETPPGEVRRRGAERDFDRAQPGGLFGDPGRIRPRRKQSRVGNHAGDGDRVRQPAGRKQSIRRQSEIPQQPENPPCTEQNRPPDALPRAASRICVDIDDRSGDRHQKIAELEGVDEYRGLAQSAGDAARGGGLERGRRGVRAEGEEELGSGE
ncbi:unnamed protein product [Linum tenue]|uniref:Phospholipase A1 n=1 Tax=Linum tenue TaxID=586396 RepID=A0AAV0GY07_9ROSI|nr:unnamed protein product [Linum tenue]